jgi:hypothetical protein
LNPLATLQHPSWGGNSIGFLPFPVDGQRHRSEVA